MIKTIHKKIVLDENNKPLEEHQYFHLYKGKSLSEGMDEVFRNFILFYVCINFLLIIAVIAQCIKNLCQSKVWEMNNYFFWREPQTPIFYNITDRYSGSFNNRFTTEYGVILNYITMLGKVFHGSYITQNKDRVSSDL